MSVYAMLIIVWLNSCNVVFLVLAIYSDVIDSLPHSFSIGVLGMLSSFIHIGIMEYMPGLYSLSPKLTFSGLRAILD